MSELIDTVTTTADNTFRLWKSDKKGKFTTKEGSKGHFSEKTFYGAKAQRKDKDRNVQVPNPDPDGPIYIDVNIEDARAMGRASNYEKIERLSKDSEIQLETIENYTAKEINEAYKKAGDGTDEGVVRYIGGK